MSDRMIRLAFYGVMVMIITLLVVLPFCALTDDVEAHHRPWHRPQPTATQVAPTATQKPATATFTRTPTATPTPVPPTATPTSTPTLAPYPPPLPTPPPGVPRAAIISVIPANFTAPWEQSLYAEIDCGIAKALSYYYAKQTGYTIWFDCYTVQAERDAYQLGSSGIAFDTTALDGFNGAHVQGFGCGPLETPCDFGFVPARAPDPDGSGPLKGGQGFNFNLVIEESERAIGQFLQHNSNGSPAGVRLYAVQNGGGVAGGATYCFEFRTLRNNTAIIGLGLDPFALDDFEYRDVLTANKWHQFQINCAENGAVANYGRSRVGDWRTNYYAGVVTLQGYPRPLDFDALLPNNIVQAMDAGCWSKYSDPSGRSGFCGEDPRSANWHEGLHAGCVDSHSPVLLGSPMVDMAPEQIIKFVDCMKFLAYPVPDWTRGAIVLASEQ